MKARSLYKIYRRRQLALMWILAIGFFIGGYQLGHIIGKRAGHDEIMRYIDDKLQQNRIKERLHQM